jgi:hypothetical protein
MNLKAQLTRGSFGGGEEEQNFTPVHYAIQESATAKSQIY